MPAWLRGLVPVLIAVAVLAVVQVVVGGLLLGLVEEFVVGYSSSSWRDAVACGFLIVVLLVRPGGLFGRVAAEKV